MIEKKLKLVMKAVFAASMREQPFIAKKRMDGVILLQCACTSKDLLETHDFLQYLLTARSKQIPLFIGRPT